MQIIPYNKPKCPSAWMIVKSLVCCLVVLLFPHITSAQEECSSAVQDTIAWNYEGDTHWAEANVARLCEGAENSTQPARCFEKVMHGGVDWGGGTHWQWENAVSLCRGTRDAGRTISCFKSRVRETDSWRDAIENCRWEWKVDVPLHVLERLGSYRPPAWRLPETTEELAAGEELESCVFIGVEATPCEQVVERHITPQGDVEVRCRDGSSWTSKAEGMEIYTTPDGRRCGALTLLATALPPAEPPPHLGENDEWAQQVNAWLDGVSSRLLQRIQQLVGSEGTENYRAIETQRTSHLYQRIDLRLAYLDRLMEHL